MSVPSLTATRADGRTVCGRCGAAYHPALVGGACPVCREPDPGGAARPRRSLHHDDRLLLVVGLATLANLVVLGLLAVAVLAS